MKIISIYLLTLISMSPVFAGENAAAFMLIPTSARYAALGEAPIAAEGDIACLFYNPAGMARMERALNVVGINRSGFIDTRYKVFAFAWNNQKFGTVAFGTIQLGIDGIQQRDNYNNILGDIKNTQQAYMLGYGRNVIGNLNLGLTLKYISMGFDFIDSSERGDGFGLDFGLHYSINQSLKFGLQLQDNFTIKWSKNVQDEMPLNLRLGGEYNTKLFNQNLSLFAGLNQKQNYPMFCSLGVEYGINISKMISAVVVRGGVSNIYIESRNLNVSTGELIENNISYSGGLGLIANIYDFKINLDYGFRSHAYLDNMHYMGFGLSY